MGFGKGLQDTSRPIQGLQQHINTLWSLVQLQKKRIATLECQIVNQASPAASTEQLIALPPPVSGLPISKIRRPPRLGQVNQPCIFADQQLTVRVVGAVLGHEQQVLHQLQQELLSEQIRLATCSGQKDAALTIHFHRMKPRLPSDELAAILHASSGKQST